MRRALMLAGASVLFVGTTWTVLNAKSETPSQRIPYRVQFFYENVENLTSDQAKNIRHTAYMEEDINKIARQGYEVVSVTAVSGQPSGVTNVSRTAHFVVVFRKKIGA